MQWGIWELYPLFRAREAKENPFLRLIRFPDITKPNVEFRGCLLP
jgi:hypothetical protein